MADLLPPLSEADRAISEEYSSACMAYQAAGMSNVPQDYAKRVEHDVWYAQIRARHLRAMQAYYDMIKRLAAKKCEEPSSNAGRPVCSLPSIPQA